MDTVIRPPTAELLYKELTWDIIGAAIEVHRALGPGLLESAYSTCLAHELTLRGLQFERERAISIQYKDVVIECAYRPDFIVAESIIVEAKAVDEISRLHVAQVLTYLRSTKLRLGLLVNFNSHNLRQGLRRVIL